MTLRNKAVAQLLNTFNITTKSYNGRKNITTSCHCHLRKYNNVLLNSNTVKFNIRLLDGNPNIKHLSTNTITSDNIVISPFDNVNVPDCLLQELIWKDVDKWPNRIALECGITGRKYTFSQLREYSKIFAATLLKSGFKPGQVLSLVLPNLPEYPIALLGAIEAGLIVTPTNPVYTSDEISHQLSNSNAVCVVTYADKLDTIKEAIIKVEQKLKQPVSIKIISIQDYDGVSRSYPDGVWSFKEMIENNIDTAIIDSTVSQFDIKNSNIAVLPYSSGTTGLPKGVCLTHNNLVSNVEQIAHKETCLNLESQGDFQDVAIAVLPFFHIYGLVIILFEGLKHGGKLITLPKFDPKNYLKSLNKHKSTILYTVPPLVLFLGSHPDINEDQLENVRYAMCAAAPIGQSDIDKFTCRFPKDVIFKQGYGLTETSPITMLSSNKETVQTTVGPPASLTKVKVIDYNTGKNLGVEENGEICIYGPQIMKEYLNRPDATAEVIDKDGWFHTGDIGYYDKNGCFYIVDRIKELIKVKGFQVAPAELEELLRCHPEVSDVAVIGVPHSKHGEAPVAYVVLKSIGETSINEKDLIEYVAGKVAGYKRLSSVIFTDNIPKNPSGKILRRKMKDAYLKST